MEGTKIKVPVRKKARIEIIPLIDVVFFLLATFVLFTLSLNRIQSVPVDLPVAAPQSSTPPDPNSNVTIQVSGEGAIFWNRELIDLGEIPSRLAFFKTQTEDPRILIAGDERARFGATVAILDEVRKAGIQKFSVETRTRPTGK
ncbi:biopolymer transporter ExbD [Oleiharenicola lentus]|jgi:biopolymer transport protein ExbD|uniref:Biopolymer transporter ExbD n=1 Tax=Oleiharenicola lentus TaxID=2508720 RepID=A0A4Q1C9D3_9BACT|nr:biopolymer transporter ExbD [Oleiharenicola lentus]RXK55486.1 biopolymer transporter ExbD [Oleiharenicola lentus]